MKIETLKYNIAGELHGVEIYLTKYFYKDDGLQNHGVGVQGELRQLVWRRTCDPRLEASKDNLLVTSRYFVYGLATGVGLCNLHDKDFDETYQEVTIEKDWKDMPGTADVG